MDLYKMVEALQGCTKSLSAVSSHFEDCHSQSLSQSTSPKTPLENHDQNTSTSQTPAVGLLHGVRLSLPVHRPGHRPTSRTGRHSPRSPRGWSPMACTCGKPRAWRSKGSRSDDVGRPGRRTTDDMRRQRPARHGLLIAGGEETHGFGASLVGEFQGSSLFGVRDRCLRIVMDSGRS